MADPREGCAPPSPPLFLDQTDAQRAEKFFFGGGGDRALPYLRVCMTTLPHPTPYLKVWIRHCSHYLCFAYVLATWFVCSGYSTSGVSLHGASMS